MGAFFPVFPLTMFTTNFHSKAKIGLSLTALVAAWCFWLWQPERQVRLHQRHLLDAAQDRKWQKLNALLDDGFRTPNGHDKTLALQQLGEVLQPFFALQIVDSETKTALDGRTGSVRTVLRINGTGLPLAEAVKTGVNQSHEPFEFIWKRNSWKPWDWRLVHTAHPLIGLAGGRDALALILRGSPHF